MKLLLPFFAAATLAASLPLRADPVTVHPATLGNVFFTGEPVRIPVATSAEKISWAATDFLGQPVTRGIVPVRAGQAIITPELGPGYFDLVLDAQSGGAKVGQTRTSLAILPPPARPRKPVDSPYGVMTHFAQSWDTDLFGLLACAGINRIRDEQYWAHIETEKGRFTFPPAFEKYMAAAKPLGVDPLIVLDYGNRLHDDTPDAPTYGDAPFTDAGRAAYARYGQEILRHYGPQIKAVEVWNEFNGTFAKGPAAADRAASYFQMLKAVYPALKQVRPDVTVVGVSAVSVPLPYFESLFKMGALPYMDAVSLHPYRTTGQPEGLERQMEQVQALIKRYNHGQGKPLWITEMGWSVEAADSRRDGAVTEADQAKYLVRAVALAQSAGVEKFYWYNARNSPAFPGIGLLRAPDDPRGRYAPKPAYVAYAALIRQLTGARFEEREPTTNEDTYSLRFRRGAETVRVMWSLAPATLTLQAAGPLKVVNLMDGTRTLTPVNGEATLPLSDVPVYVWGNVTGLPPATRAAGRLVADSEEGFSSQQGAGGWSYGSFEAPAPGGQYTPSGWKPCPRYQVTLWNYEWVGDALHLRLGPDEAEPGMAHGRPVWAVRRWTSNMAGNLRVRAKFGCTARQGDGTTARVFVDGKEVWQQPIGGRQPDNARCDVTVPVRAGSLVDIAVDPGPGTDADYDATSCRVVMDAVE